MSDRDDGPNPGRRRDTQQRPDFGLFGSAVRPADAATETERTRRDQDPLGRSALIVGVLVGMFAVHQDGDRDRSLGDVLRIRRKLRYSSLNIPVANHDEHPRLTVLRAAGPAGDLEDGPDRRLVDGLVGEAPDLPRAPQGPQHGLG